MFHHTPFPFPESDDLRGNGTLSLLAPEPQDARNSIVDAGGIDSITQCPQHLPQMMAAGKCWWPAQDTSHFEFLVGKRAQP